jgi:multiple sugar transport system permease protein
MNKKSLRLVSAEVAMGIGSLFFVIPCLLLVLAAFKPDSEIVKFQGFLPKQWTLANFQEVLGNPEENPLLRWLYNSIIISVSTATLVLTVSSLAAWSMARLRLPGKPIVYGIVLATLMVPGQILLVPIYLLLNTLGWLDTPLALIVPAAGGAFGVFMLHQFFIGIPKDLEEAAALDGCSRISTFMNVIVPLSRAPMATLFIFTFVGSWNDFLGPLVFLDSLERYTLPVGIALFQTSYFTEYGLTLAASLLCTLPTFIAFMIFQRQLISGMAASGLKE